MSSGVSHMSFMAFDKIEKLFEGKGSISTYEVKINPETFDRSINTCSLTDETKEGKGKGKNELKSEGESYSFDLMFDGTGVVGAISSAETLQEEFNSFLTCVYRAQESGSSDGESQGGEKSGGEASNNGNANSIKTPPVNFVKIFYCGQYFNTKLDSLSIKYLLFNKDGLPLRIKASCRFSSVSPASATSASAKSSEPEEKEAQPLKDDSPTKKNVKTEKTYKKTVKKAEENDSVSLMCCCCCAPQPEPTSQNYTPTKSYSS